MNRAERDQHRAAAEAFVIAQEDQVQAAIARALRDVWTPIIDAVRRAERPDLHPRGLDGFRATLRDAFREHVTPLLGKLYRVGALGGLQQVGALPVDPHLWQSLVADAGDLAGPAWDVVSQNAVDYMASAENRLVGIGQNAWEATRSAIADAMAQGKDWNETADIIQGRLTEISRNRSLVIARTETNTALNNGSIDGVRALGPDLAPGSKQWVAVMDDRTREEHAAADGTVVALNETFDVDYSGQDVPDAPNCRCTIVYLDTATPLDTSGHWEDGQWVSDSADLGLPVDQYPTEDALLNQPIEGMRSMIDALTEPDGGFTLSTVGDNPVEGFAVAVPGHSGIMNIDDFLTVGADGITKGEDFIQSWLRDNAKLFDDPNMHIGGWHDPEHHAVTLDPAEVLHDRDAAIKAGQDRGEQKIADLKAISEGDWDHAFIDTGGTGGYDEAGVYKPEPIVPASKPVVPNVLRLPDIPVVSPERMADIASQFEAAAATPAEEDAFLTALVKSAALVVGNGDPVLGEALMRARITEAVLDIQRLHEADIEEKDTEADVTKTSVTLEELLKDSLRSYVSREEDAVPPLARHILDAIIPFAQGKILKEGDKLL